MGALSCLAHNDPSNQLAIATGLVALLGSGTAEAQEQVTQMLIKFAQVRSPRHLPPSTPFSLLSPSFHALL